MTRAVSGLRATVLGSLVILCGCISEEPCPHYGMPASPAIFVTVSDASTGEPINQGVLGIAVVGGETFQLETAVDVGDANQFWVYGPAGTYELFLARDGYLAWYRGGVTVSGTRCLISSTSVKAEMVPADDGLSNGPLQPPPAPGE